MKFGIVSLEGVSLWAAARLQDEGEEVLMYHAPPHDNVFAEPINKHTGEGIVPLAKTWEQFVAWKPDIAIFDCSDYGKKADALRASGVAVFGSSAFYDKLEKDRTFGINVAKKIGMTVPEFYEFGSISESLAWLKDRKPDESWFFKSDRELGAAFTAGGDIEHLTARLKYIRVLKGDRIKHILQKKINGMTLSTAGYWNGVSFVRPWEATLEHKEFGNDDTGPKTGCSTNVIWFYPNEPKIVLDEHWDALVEIMRKAQAPPCILDINAILSYDDGLPYFLEWTPRFGIDSEPTAQRLLQIPYGEFIARLCEATLPLAPFALDAAAFSIRLSVPPYPYEPDAKHLPAIGLPLLDLKGSLWGEKPRDRFVAYGVRQGEDRFECSCPYGLVGISSVTGTNLEVMNNAVVAYAKSLGIPDLGFRTDGEVALAKDLAGVRKAGYPAPLL